MPKSNNEFGRIRSILWPIYRHEFNKAILIILMFTFIIFNYTVLRDIKDTLIITATGGGAELIPFLKLWGVLPVSIVFMILYINLSNKLSKNSLFCVSLIPFIIFFALFALVLYPAKNYIHPNKFCDKLIEILPMGLHGLVGAIRNWTFSLFYIISELWGSIVLSLLGWGVANDIISLSQSKRFYPLINLITNVAIVLAGLFTELVSNLKSNASHNYDAWQLSLNYFMLSICLSGIIILFIYWQLTKNIVSYTKCFQINKNKKNQSINEIFQQLLSSSHLKYIALIVVAYGFCISCIEIIWKNQIKLQYPDPNIYSAFMGTVSKYTGVFSFFMLLFLGNSILNKFSWKTSALITPIIMLFTSSIFFITLVFNNELIGVLANLGTTPLMLGVLFGAGQNIIAKSCKYSFFDITKEVVYIPLSEEEKVKGKAAIEILASRLGKSGASFMQCIILCFGSLMAMTSYIAILLLIIILTWIFAIKSLNNKFVDFVDFAKPIDDTQLKTHYTKKSSKEYVYDDKKYSVDTK